MARLLCLMLGLHLGLGGCGNADTHGSLGGQGFAQGEAIFAVVRAAQDANDSTTGDVGVVLIASTPHTCEALGANAYFAQASWALQFLYNQPQSGSSRFDVGSYAIETPERIAAQFKAGDPRPQRLGYGDVYAFDATCKAAGMSPYTLTGGVVDVVSIDPNSHVQLHFTLSSDANETLTGSLTARYCAALGALFDGSSAPSGAAATCLSP